ncbi:hypothetical protein WISP_41334 [Willisornis vidua]|uniref:Uncharacterized protein n=1 Tax=Willisornis vidua TaxID=1566151 RepID=A0ABQ9DGR1_9PASS|nr:hypothetical protein WISP_41334 [Willisornis vidua]
MPAPYQQRALTVLLLFGVLSAAMALLSSNLLFQLPFWSGGHGAGDVPGWATRVMVPVAAAFAALCLVFNLSCLLLCLLHGYFSTELCQGQPRRDR